MKVVDTLMLPTRFLCLKHLTIYLGSFPWSYDYFSLVSFLVVSPSLETLSLNVWSRCWTNYLHFLFIFIGIKETYEGWIDCLKNPHSWGKRLKASISTSKMWRSQGSALQKALVELTCYILKNAVSLDCLTLDIHYGSTRRCSDSILDSAAPWAMVRG